MVADRRRASLIALSVSLSVCPRTMRRYERKGSLISVASPRRRRITIPHQKPSESFIRMRGSQCCPASLQIINSPPHTGKNRRLSHSNARLHNLPPKTFFPPRPLLPLLLLLFPKLSTFTQDAPNALPLFWPSALVRPYFALLKLPKGFSSINNRRSRTQTSLPFQSMQPMRRERMEDREAERQRRDLFRLNQKTGITPGTTRIIRGGGGQKDNASVLCDYHYLPIPSRDVHMLKLLLLK